MPLLFSTPLSLYADALDAELQRLSSGGILPEDFLGDALHRVGVMQVSSGVDPETASWSFAGSFELDGEVALAIPGLDFFKLIVGAHPERPSPNAILDVAAYYADGQVTVSLLDVDVILEIDGGGFVQSLVPDPSGTYELGGVAYAPAPLAPIRFNTERGLDFHFSSDGTFTMTGPEGWTFAPFCVPALSLAFSLENVIVRLSTSDPLPPELADRGFADDWVGFSCESFAVAAAEGSLFEGIVSNLSVADLAIGRGGFSGTITAGPWTPVLNAAGTGFNPGTGVTELFGIPVGVESVAVTVQENSVVASGIAAKLIVPFFDAPLAVAIGLANDGGFTVGLSADEGLVRLEKEGLLSATLESVEFLQDDGAFSIRMTGEVQPDFGGELDWPSFALKGLTIGSDGRVQIEGGWIELPEQKALDFHGFQIEITALGFGQEEIDGTLYRWIGFSGGIQIVQGVPLEGGVEGLKILWSSSGDIRLQIGGVSIGFEIADVLSFAGRVFFFEEGSAKGFGGGVSITLVPLNGLGAEAQFLAGYDSARHFSFFYIYLNVSLPLGIPIVPPALGLYGLAGLFGYNATVDKSPDDEWYADFYKAPDEGVTDPRKWKGEADALALGAGVTLRTLPDTGFTFSGKVLLVVLIPGPVILIEGMAAIIKKDISSEEDFPFKVLAVLDGESGTFLLNVEAGYAFPKLTGDLLDAGGVAEAFFNFNNAGDWHVYLGQDEPESKRIHADILRFFKATTYFMVDSDGLRLGVWIGYALEEKYGPLRVLLAAWIDGRLALSFQPIQAKGSITLFGGAELKAFGIGVGVSVEANVAAEAPKPLALTASLKVKIKTPLGDPSATVKLKWSLEGDPGYTLVLGKAGTAHAKVTENRDLFVTSGYTVDEDGIWTGGAVSDAVDWDTVAVVPPDTQVVLGFGKPVWDETGLSLVPLGPPADEAVGNYLYRYTLANLTLEESPNGASWEDVDAGDLFGAWQAVEGRAGLQQSQLVLGAVTPFEMFRELESAQSLTNGFLSAHPEYPCQPESAPAWRCATFAAFEVGQSFAFVSVNGFLFLSDELLTVVLCQRPQGAVNALETVPPVSEKTCIDLAGTRPGSVTGTRVIDGVSFVAGTAAPLEFQAQPSGTQLYVSLSRPVGGRPAVIAFGPRSFPVRPVGVELGYYFSTDVGFAGVFSAFDVNGNLIARGSAPYTSTRRTFVVKADVPLAPGASPGIDRIEIAGALLHITDLCYLLPPGDDPEEMKVVFPEDVAQVSLSFCPGSAGVAVAYDNLDRELLRSVFTGAPDVPVQLTHRTPPIRAVVVSGDFRLIEACGLPVDDFETAEVQDTLTRRIETTLTEIWNRTEADIFAPNRYYKLRVNTRAERKKPGGSWQEPVEYTEYVYFRTGSPPGTSGLTATPSLQTDQQQGYPADGPLKDLSAYVLRTIPEAAGAGSAAIPAYRSYDVGLEYNEPYVVQMYLAGGYALKIRLSDSNGASVCGQSGVPVLSTNLWASSTARILSSEEALTERLFNEADCTEMVLASSPAGGSVPLSEVTPILLAPQTPHTARLMAVGEGVEHEVYRFIFRTSAFASFRHHLHSFAGAVWDNHAVLADASYVVDPTALGAALGATLDEPMRFDQLRTVFGLPASRPLPAGVELTLLNDASARYGLLLESPEPLDWDRTALSLSRAGGTTVLPVNEAAALIASVMLPPATDPNKQWVDVLLREALDLSGYTIEHGERTASTDEDFTAFFTFPAGSVFEEGTLVRVYGGTAPSAPEETEDVHLYAGHPAPAFTLPRAQVRLLTGARAAMHTRLFLREALYASLPATVVRNVDGTRAFIFLEGGMPVGSLDDAVYRLAFTFTRDARSDLPLLLRRGFSTAEVALLEFTLPPASGW